MDLTSEASDKHHNTPSRLSGHLGPLPIVFMVVAAAAPLTIFVTVPLNMINGNGPGIAFSYILGPVILLFFGAGFAAMSVHVKKAGAFYSYVTAAMGRPVGVGAGFLAMLGYFVSQIFVYILQGFAVSALLVSFTGSGVLPWWAWTLVAMAGVGVLGYFNIEVSAKVLGVALLLEVVIILILDFAILLKGGGPEGIQVAAYFTPEVITSGSLPLGILFGISVGLGFEATALFRDEARDPAKTIPKAVYLSILAGAVFYGFAVWAWMQAFGVHGVMDAVAADPEGVVYESASQWVGPIFMQILNIFAITSMFACTLSYQNITTRYLHSLGHSVLPIRLTRVHIKHKSPYIASMVSSALGLMAVVLVLLSGIDPYVFIGWGIAVGTLCPLILFTLTSVAIVVFFRRNPGLPVSTWVSTVSPIVSFLLFGAIVVFALPNFSTLSGAGPGINIVLQLVPVAVFLLGIVVALIAKRVSPARYEGLKEHGVAVSRNAEDEPAEPKSAVGHDA